MADIQDGQPVVISTRVSGAWGNSAWDNTAWQKGQWSFTCGLEMNEHTQVD